MVLVLKSDKNFLNHNILIPIRKSTIIDIINVNTQIMKRLVALFYFMIVANLVRGKWIANIRE